MTTTVCRQCNADTTQLRLGRVEGENDGVHVAIEGLPALDCSNGHKRFPTPGFPLEFIQKMLAQEGLITAEPAVEKGLFRKRRLCPACSTELSGAGSETSVHRATVPVPDGEPVSVELSLPAQHCACGREVTLPKGEVERGVMQATANAFRSADIPPG
jgi:hypothetical protein